MEDRWRCTGHSSAGLVLALLLGLLFQTASDAKTPGHVVKVRPWLTLSHQKPPCVAWCAACWGSTAGAQTTVWHCHSDSGAAHPGPSH